MLGLLFLECVREHWMLIRHGEQDDAGDVCDEYTYGI